MARGIGSTGRIQPTMYGSGARAAKAAATAATAGSSSAASCAGEGMAGLPAADPRCRGGQKRSSGCVQSAAGSAIDGRRAQGLIRDVRHCPALFICSARPQEQRVAASLLGWQVRSAIGLARHCCGVRSLSAVSRDRRNSLALPANERRAWPRPPVQRLASGGMSGKPGKLVSDHGQVCGCTRRLVAAWLGPQCAAGRSWPVPVGKHDQHPPQARLDVRRRLQPCLRCSAAIAAHRRLCAPASRSPKSSCVLCGSSEQQH